MKNLIIILLLLNSDVAFGQILSFFQKELMLSGIDDFKIEKNEYSRIQYYYKNVPSADDFFVDTVLSYKNSIYNLELTKSLKYIFNDDKKFFYQLDPSGRIINEVQSTYDKNGYLENIYNKKYSLRNNEIDNRHSTIEYIDAFKNIEVLTFDILSGEEYVSSKIKYYADGILDSHWNVKSKGELTLNIISTRNDNVLVYDVEFIGPDSTVLTTYPYQPHRVELYIDANNTLNYYDFVKLSEFHDYTFRAKYVVETKGEISNIQHSKPNNSFSYEDVNHLEFESERKRYKGIKYKKKSKNKYNSEGLLIESEPNNGWYKVYYEYDSKKRKVKSFRLDKNKELDNFIMTKYLK